MRTKEKILSDSRYNGNEEVGILEALLDIRDIMAKSKKPIRVYQEELIQQDTIREIINS